MENFIIEMVQFGVLVGGCYFMYWLSGKFFERKERRMFIGCFVVAMFWSKHLFLEEKIDLIIENQEQTTADTNQD